jgi:outer membrane protein W
MKIFGTMLAAGLLLSAGIASAQVKQGQQLFGVDAGLALPMSDLNNSSNKVGDAGPALGFTYDYMALKNLSIGGDFSYKDYGTDNVGFGGFSANVWTLVATGKFQLMPENKLRPYGLLGLGVGHATQSFTALNGNEQTNGGTGFAYVLGVGGDYDINSQWAVGGEMRWTGLSATIGNAVNSQGFNSLDFLLTARFKVNSGS